jgi:hypothetical protein
MSFANRVLSELELGQWTISSIAPSFARRLAGEIKIQDFEKSISELCMSHYGKIRPHLVSTSRNKKLAGSDELSLEVKNLIQNILRADDPDSSVINFESNLLQRLLTAMELINDSNPAISELIEKIVASFVRVDSSSFRSASHPHLFGLILIGDKANELTPPELAISIVHELAHQELFLINMLDRLVNQPFDYNEVHAPFQGVKRPPIGRLHSLWALYRMVEFQMKNNNVNQKHKDLLHQNALAFEDQELTPFAKKLVEIAVRRVS